MFISFAKKCRFLTLYFNSVTEDFKVNPGAVETISQQPGDPDRILIGYTRGLLVLWNRKSLSADQVIGSIQFINNSNMMRSCILRSCWLRGQRNASMQRFPVINELMVFYLTFLDFCCLTTIGKCKLARQWQEVYLFTQRRFVHHLECECDGRRRTSSGCCRRQERSFGHHTIRPFPL